MPWQSERIGDDISSPTGPIGHGGILWSLFRKDAMRRAKGVAQVAVVLRQKKRGGEVMFRTRKIQHVQLRRSVRSDLKVFWFHENHQWG